ncbi:HD domain-containing protein, partial [candidate division KSB1 bacterium]|nr:HD domain-containing protein [candidate division KSB1 bacterium]
MNPAKQTGLPPNEVIPPTWQPGALDSPFKRFSDPVHGFISVPRTLLLDLIQTPEVQRLRRIRQLGVGYLVFPGGEHMRFTHALGAMALMQDTLASLAEKGTPITPEEHRAALAAALLHDVGHGPFSHTLEFELIDGFRHVPVLVGVAQARLRDGQHLNPAQGSACLLICSGEQIVYLRIARGQREGVVQCPPGQGG